MKITQMQIRFAHPVLMFAILSLSSLSALAQSAMPVKSAQVSTKKSVISVQPLIPVTQDPGERKFQANCSRCHNAPEQLSPRIVGTVVRHMRVRASLSAEDERDILRYLAP